MQQQQPAIPLHEQLRNILTHEIESGLYEQSRRLPSETELGKRFSVSRITVRRAVSELEAAGLVQRRQGQGTFVSGPRTATAILSLGGFSDQFIAQGESRRIVTAERITADAAIADSLGITEGAAVFHLVRVLSADGQPLAVDDCHYSLDRYPGLDSHITESTSTYRVLREEYGVRFAEVTRTIGASYASEDRAFLLDRPVNDPLTLIDKLVTDENGAVIHTSRLESVPARLRLRVVTTAPRSDDDAGSDRPDAR